MIRDQLTVLPYGPAELNCSYDRSCNLSCPSCRIELIVETDRKQQILRIQDRLSREALGNARRLDITGSGNPFGSPFFREWLRTMRIEDMPQLRRIHLHSNGQLWTPAVWETIPPPVRRLVTSAEIAIDAARAETYHLNRRGGDLAGCSRTSSSSARCAQGPLEWLRMSFVVQENNFREMPEFVELGRRFFADELIFNQLVNWGTFSPGRVPQARGPRS